MSGIAGFWNLNGDPAEEKVLERMVSAIAHRGPHGRGMRVSGPVALGFTAFHETPESIHEQQPWADESGQVWLTMDGRVDNREDLSAAIESAGRQRRNDTDAELVLRAYQVWGEDCPAHIVGDFGFVVWDAVKQALFCARDYIGIRPFLYFSDGGRFVWASEPVGLLTHPDVPKRPNEGMIAEFLAPELASRRETLFEKIFRLESGHCLTADRHGLRQRRYWDPESIAPVGGLLPDEYAEGFLDVFKTATASHLRSVGRPGLFLSGGLDSSSVACTARRFSLCGTSESSRLKAYSLVFPGMPYDESRFIDEVVSSYGIESFRVAPEPMALEWYVNAATRSADFPGYPNGTSPMFFNSAMEFTDATAVLCGIGGDELLNGDPKHYASLLVAGRLGEFARAIRNESLIGGEPHWRLLLRYAVKPSLPRGLRRSLDEIRFGGQADWIRPEFAQRVGLAHRVAAR